MPVWADRPDARVCHFLGLESGTCHRPWLSIKPVLVPGE